MPQEYFKKKVNVAHLIPGMYVTALDRSWLDTPFTYQGFKITSVEEINTLAEYCEYVVIDATKGLDVAPEFVITSSEEGPSAKITGITPYEGEVPLEMEIHNASKVRTDTKQVIDSLYHDAKMGEQLDLKTAKNVVSDLVDSIIRNPDALMLLTQLKNKDEYTAIHSVNVCVMSISFGRYLEMPREDLFELGYGAMMHDLGKMKIPDEILLKEGPLTIEEFEIVKKHPEDGKKILENEKEDIPFRVVDVAYSHHERTDGSGYPLGLMGDTIPLFARVVAIVDIYDAVTSKRSYRDGMTSSDAMRDIYEQRKGQLDEELVEKFIQCLGIFPLGSVIELNTGEIGIVISHNRQKNLKPKILLLLDQDKNAYPRPKILDMAIFQKGDKFDYMVKNVLNPERYGINLSKYLVDLSWAD